MGVLIYLKGGEVMTLQQEQFCIEYLKDYNATKSAIRAKYSKKSAYAIGSKLLKKVEIQEYIKDRFFYYQRCNNINELLAYLTSLFRSKHKSTSEKIMLCELIMKVLKFKLTYGGLIPEVFTPKIIFN